jgi:hypothetical protein
MSLNLCTAFLSALQVSREGITKKPNPLVVMKRRRLAGWQANRGCTGRSSLKNGAIKVHTKYTQEICPVNKILRGTEIDRQDLKPHRA